MKAGIGCGLHSDRLQTDQGQYVSGDEKGATMVQHQAEAFLAGAIFAVHPIHTDAVASIVGQAELLSAAFSLGAILLYAQAADVW